MHTLRSRIQNSLVHALLVSSLLLALQFGMHAQGADINDTRLIAQPAIGKTHIAFIYAGDLWAADLDGRNVRRLTADEGVQSNPAFSPDGSLVAFTAQYDGNLDVYVVPAISGKEQMI